MTVNLQDLVEDLSTLRIGNEGLVFLADAEGQNILSDPRFPSELGGQLTEAATASAAGMRPIEPGGEALLIRVERIGSDLLLVATVPSRELQGPGRTLGISIAASTLAVAVGARGAREFERHCCRISIHRDRFPGSRAIPRVGSQGGTGLMRQIVDVFLQSSDQMVSQLQQAVAAGDAEALRQSAHSLKSSSANVGAQTLSELFRSLEGFGQEENFDAAEGLLDTMRLEYGRAVDKLGQVLAKAA